MRKGRLAGVDKEWRTHLTWKFSSGKILVKWDPIKGWYSPDAPLQLVLSTVSFPVNWSTVWEQGESRWARAGSLLWLGNGPNVPCSAYPASQMDDDEVMGGRQKRVCSPGGLRRGRKHSGADSIQKWGRREREWWKSYDGLEMERHWPLPARHHTRAHCHTVKVYRAWKFKSIEIMSSYMMMCLAPVSKYELNCHRPQQCLNLPFNSETYSPIRPTINRFLLSPSWKWICVIACVHSQSVQQVAEN